MEVKAIAGELPAIRAVPLGRWSLAELGDEVITTGLIDQISVSTLWRWLHEDAIKPWQQRCWLFMRDPAFREKAGRVLDLYQRRFEGGRLLPDELVVCADEKSQLQALGHRHETVLAGRERPALVEFEYRRHGTLAYLAAWDVHHANLFDHVEPKTGIEPFGRLVEQVMSSEPYASARTVFWIVDNGSSHAGKASIQRLEGAWENLRLIHLPIHASWLNQIELYFSIVQRKALTPNEFASAANSPTGSCASATTTARSPSPSTGPSPAQTSTPSSPRSPSTNPSSRSRPNPPNFRITSTSRSRGARPCPACPAPGSARRRPAPPRAGRPSRSPAAAHRRRRDV